ncbi:MAG: WbqC family protein [Bacteroidota bacterium]
MSTTTTAIRLELQYLPPVQYFSKFFCYDEVIIEQHENYQKGSYRNRCHIAGVNGLLRLSIPLESGKNQAMPIRDVKIAYAENWQTHHWTSIRSAYGNAPFFEYYVDYLQPCFQQKVTYLFDWNIQLLSRLLQLLQLENYYQLSDAYQKVLATNELDFRNGIFPKKKRQKADSFFQTVSYPQVFEEKHGFIPNLSILDLLFCTGPQAALILEQSVKLDFSS